MPDLQNDLIKYTPREEQQKVHDYIFKVKEENPNIKFFLLDLPTGSGKSFAAMMIINTFINKIDKESKVDIITASKILQNQYSDTYESISNLKGKDNYSCYNYQCSCSQGMEFNRLNKTSCDFCPYDTARQSYITGKISLTNFHLYLIYALYNPKIFDGRKSKILIVDECCEVDPVMCDFISIKITENIIKKLKFTNEYDIIRSFNKVKNINNYINFLKSLDEEIVQTIDSIENSMSGSNRSVISDKRDLKINKLIGGLNNDIKLMQIITDLRQYQLKIEIFLKEYENDNHNWIFETTYNEKTSQRELSLEPIWAHDYLNKYVWSKYDMVVLMSGTILDKKIFAELNGVDLDKSVYYTIPSPFPLKNRPVYYLPVGKMSYNKKEETFRKYIPMINKILTKYKDKRGIIHTNSFELSDWIKNSVNNDRLLFHSSDDKDEILERHFESKDTVIVSPSMSIGVSFDNDKSRFQIIAKIPYPSLASQKNKLRKQNNPEWYSWKTISSLLQMTGRSIRSKIDFADTIIIDESFGDVMKYSSHFIPSWFQQSIKKINIKN